MKNFDEFEIKLAGLKEGEHTYSFHIDNTFFALFDYQEFNAVDVDVDLKLTKLSTMLELAIEVNGSVNVNCDVSTLPYDQPIESDLFLKIKFGEVFNDENDEVLVLPHSAHYLEVQQYVYEAIVLAVPLKKVHPGVEDGTLDSDILDKLDELSPGQSKNENENTDPRWDQLKKLLNDK